MIDKFLVWANRLRGDARADNRVYVNVLSDDRLGVVIPAEQEQELLDLLRANEIRAFSRESFLGHSAIGIEGTADDITRIQAVLDSTEAREQQEEWDEDNS